MKQLKNKHIILDAKNISEYQREMHYVNCTITFKCSAKDMMLWHNKFENCSLVFTKKIVKYFWENDMFVNCKFEGTFDDNIFGTFSTYSDYPFCGFDNCDFSKATLIACRFLNVKPETTILPKWPCFSIIYPKKNGAVLLKEPWPGEDLLITIETIADEDEETTFITDEANAIIKHTNATLTAEELKAKLSKFDFVIM